MADLVDLYNQALDASGVRDRVSSTSEVSRGAETCTLWYNAVRQQVLSAAYWPSARANKRLALSVERSTTADWVSTDPDPGFKYAYSTPNDFLRARWLSDFSYFIVSTNSVNSRVISTNMDEALLTYTKDQTNINLWGPELYMAIVYALAAHICIPLHGKNVRARDVENRANALIYTARETALNSDAEQYESIPSWLSARGSAFNTAEQRFMFPYGPMISVTAGAPVT